jgi:hypothetical protein
MPSVGFEPTILVFERAKAVHGLDRAATVIGITVTNELKRTWTLYFHVASFQIWLEMLKETTNIVSFLLGKDVEGSGRNSNSVFTPVFYWIY